jgi:hypothetical protein
VTEARVDEHSEALPEVDRLFEADDRSITLRTAEPLIMITIRGDRSIVEEVVVAHLFGQVRETKSTALAAVLAVQIFWAG